MHTSRVGPLGIVVLAAALASGCGSSREIADAELSSCVTCHGGLDNQTGAPPNGLDGQATGPAVGAHTTHIAAGVACASCHVVPAADGTGHPSSRRAVVTFGGLALAGSAADRARTGPPVYDPVTYTCSSVYCHGGTLDAGGSITAPSWSMQLPNCGTCHGYAPPSHALFPTRLNCSMCHGASVESDNTTLKASHLDGTLNFN